MKGKLYHKCVYPSLNGSTVGEYWYCCTRESTCTMFVTILVMNVWNLDQSVEGTTVVSSERKFKLIVLEVDSLGLNAAMLSALVSPHCLTVPVLWNSFYGCIDCYDEGLLVWATYSSGHLLEICKQTTGGREGTTQACTLGAAVASLSKPPATWVSSFSNGNKTKWETEIRRDTRDSHALLLFKLPEHWNNLNMKLKNKITHLYA